MVTKTYLKPTCLPIYLPKYVTIVTGMTGVTVVTVATVFPKQPFVILRCLFFRYLSRSKRAAGNKKFVFPNSVNKTKPINFTSADIEYVYLSSMASHRRAPHTYKTLL